MDGPRARARYYGREPRGAPSAPVASAAALLWAARASAIIPAITLMPRSPIAHRPMSRTLRTARAAGIAVGAALAAAAPRATAQTPAPIVYTVSVPDPATHIAHVQARVPTSGRASIEMMMATWSPGYYKVEDYANQVDSVRARAADGSPLAVQRSRANRWRIDTHGAPSVTISYQVLGNRKFVTADWVGDSLVVLNGAPTFMTLADTVHRPAEIHLSLPPGWSSATSLDSASDGVLDHYRAADYDDLVDSPIMAGALRTVQFDVDGIPHLLVDAGAVGDFNGERAGRDLMRIVIEASRFWGFLPYRRYLFLNWFHPGGGGLEHKNSTMLTSNAAALDTPAGYERWLTFVAHEYFHAFNVKRLRPVELGPFDYEGTPHTPSLWIAEGLTTYYGDLMVARAGLARQQDYLDWMSAMIRDLQRTPGRLVQTLDASSLDVWNSENSAVGMDTRKTVSYYTKGPVVGLLLDAHIRHLTNGAKSLDDVMRLAYRRYAGAQGYTPAQFRATVSEVAGVDLSDWFARALDSTQELDYAEMLDWFGLRFSPADQWQLDVVDKPTPDQQHHLQALLKPDSEARPD